MPLTIQDILDRSGALILETQENSITPPRVGELTYALAELILQGSLGGNVIGASKLKELEDVMLLGEQDNDILQLMGGKWKNTNLDLTKLQAMAGYFELDDDDNLFTNYNLYSTKEISAYGAGSGGGGTSFSRLDEWSLYTNDKSGWVLSALLGKELHDRVLVLEAGGGGGGIATEIDPTVAAHIKNITSGDIANWAEAYTKSHEHLNISILNATTASFLTADRTKLDGIAAGANNYTHPATHAPSIIAQDANNRFVTDANIATWNAKANGTHTHTWASIESKPNVITGTTASFTTELETKLNGIAAGANNYTHPATHAPSIIAQDANNRFVTDINIASWNSKANGTHTHTWDSIESKPTTLSEYGITDVYTKTQIDGFLALKLDVSTFNDLFEKVNIGTELSPVYAIKAKYNFYSVGEIAGLGAGTGDSGTNFSRLDAWSLYTNDKSGWVLSALLGKELHDRVLVLEAGGGGGGTGIVYNGLDSTETDIALSAYMGNVLNTNKLEVSTFNSWVSNYVPPAPAWGDVTGKPSTFPATAHVHGWSEIENKPTTFAPSTHTHTWASIESKPNVITGTTASFTTELETKLSGIAAGANNYTHPATHAPSIIAQDANNRFVTDTNIASWNSKANGTHGHYKSDIIDFAHTHNLSEIGITELSENHLTMYDGSTLVSSILIDDGDSLSVTGSGNINIYAGKIGYYPTVSNFDSGGSNYASYGLSINAEKVGLSGYSGLALFTNNEERISILTNGNVGIGTASPAVLLDVNGIGKFKDDILMTFNTWTHPTNKNSLDKFLKLFDIDTAGNLVVKTNLYGTGEIAALGAGTGVSELTLMADMNANGKNINNLTSISKSGSKISLSDPTFITFSLVGRSDQFVIADDGIYANTSIEASSFYASGAVNATEFKFGNWTFKQDVSGRLGIYNGATEVACFNTDGTYVNL